MAEADQNFTTALDEFRSEVDTTAATERERRRDRAPDPACTLRRAALPTTRLWQRRPGAPRLLEPARRRRQRALATGPGPVGRPEAR